MQLRAPPDPADCMGHPEVTILSPGHFSQVDAQIRHSPRGNGKEAEVCELQKLLSLAEHLAHPPPTTGPCCGLSAPGNTEARPLARREGASGAPVLLLPGKPHCLVSHIGLLEPLTAGRIFYSFSGRNVIGRSYRRQQLWHMLAATVRNTASFIQIYSKAKQTYTAITVSKPDSSLYRKLVS